jgi:hypothetical protein
MHKPEDISEQFWVIWILLKLDQFDVKDVHIFGRFRQEFI